ncbi:uncharacterized protein LOC111201789 [Brassica napus]|uniref:uncharacterized protein LOC111201789 n=1 Tax=Brassica napus TaxID=3708 RepID=UPI000BBE8BFC|nr:uncharacterized protein LOC111201789 [Brassica napus]
MAEYFQSKRGLRQGCSLSPYLFVLCMNILSHKIDRAAKERKFTFHPRCKSLALSHLCFADDLMVIVEGTKESIEGALSVFDEFAAWSGFSISIEKSTVYMAGVSSAERSRILVIFSFAEGTLPVRYLGLPLMTQVMRRWFGDKRAEGCKSGLWVEVNMEDGLGKISMGEMDKREFIKGEKVLASESQNSNGLLDVEEDVENERGDRGIIDMGIKREATVEKAVFSARRRRRHRTLELNEIEEELLAVKEKMRSNAEDVALWKRKSDFKPTFSTQETWMLIRDTKSTCNWAKGLGISCKRDSEK